MLTTTSLPLYRLLPLRPKAKADVPTIQTAANEAAKRRARSANQAALSPFIVRQPSKLEQTFIYRLSQSILRHRLEVIPVVREAIKTRSVRSTAKNDKKENAEDKERKGDAAAQVVEQDKESANSAPTNAVEEVKAA